MTAEQKDKQADDLRETIESMIDVVVFDTVNNKLDFTSKYADQLLPLITAYADKKVEDSEQEYGEQFAKSYMEATEEINKANIAKAVKEERERICKRVDEFLDIYEDPDGGYIRISNHRQYSDWKALSDGSRK